MYECVIVGGGIAGLQAAIQLGRYEHHVAIIDNGGGRSSLCRRYHNLLGWPDGISGQAIREAGRKQATSLGVEFIDSSVHSVRRQAEHFVIETESTTFEAKRLLLATGISDRIPPFPSLYPMLGKHVFLCPDCDGYEVRGQDTIVIGSGQAGANLSLALTYWKPNLMYINHEQQPLSPEVEQKLASKNILVVHEKVETILHDEETFQGVMLQDGTVHSAPKAFLAMGGAKVESDLAKQLGVERLENHHIVVNPRTKETNVKHVWAVGDVTVHSQLLSIAMGDGAQAAIWIHKSLLHERT
ncbi:NAD(P)/FAD-dependent oxidoreductase [Halalkalibacterium halodurans]|uniref:NAD(P)/FAD-dependent oxidoreductase n=1 Tax=Halalkalibacterium halodurans TaxID=86665 RepID=UPI00106794F0|nr:NAD(P)/FAD-dependent oxidoreductase [Halalkalibacterium halodurans]MED3648294.1 NAD(P)/FAD-dependent oxidoreductase [Halalkalibacterium halodurans]TES55035.1 NAD(P)/FAD-dependent oxidoreductase [Halalkalibacterium halodurans]